MWRQVISVFASIYNRLPWRRTRQNIPLNNFVAEPPPEFRHGNTKRVKQSVLRYRRWRRTRMRMQRESRRRNRAA
jgi:hypothetical protein